MAAWSCWLTARAYATSPSCCVSQSVRNSFARALPYTPLRSVVRSSELRDRASTAACVKSGSPRSRLRVTRIPTNTSWPNSSSSPVRSSTAGCFGACAAICMPFMPVAADDRVAEGEAAGRVGLPAVQPQAPSTRAGITIHAATGMRIWPERAAQVPSVTVARVPIKVLFIVILPGHWLTTSR